jgi:Tfp pilus assembly protein PilO
MKSKTITAIIIAAALVILTYLLFFNNKKQQQSFNLAGEWVLDSAYSTQAGSDSSLEMLTGILSYTPDKPILHFHATVH